MFAWCLVVVCLFGGAFATPKKYGPEDGFQPINRYYESNLPPNADFNKSAEAKDSSGDRLRFGVSTYSGSGYGTSGGGGYNVASSGSKDIGGILVGVLIGLSAVLFLPKIAGLFSGGHYRSMEDNVSSVTDILARIDNSLEQHNIDSSSCMQRVVCNYLSEVQKNIKNHESSSVDDFVNSLANNALLTYALEGTAIKQAMEMGKLGDVDKCSGLDTKCPLNKENVMKVITSLLPA